ncbi:MAG: protein arginine N-methyltransferase 7 [Parasphingorhabdus sp.]|uniref:50S ribosomal protein L11 methyltransferase n=1 Tax=Parasphingorhabdus sp. TaxID=2709688 RepID=UPI001B400F04|nr:50S ribosomal protein L11 methyltransferase [Parasphingorhabdus sp.]MBQ0771697.1 50S ribosomal protein L11 methyltransferase [Sphingomonadales bacterium]
MSDIEKRRQGILALVEQSDGNAAALAACAHLLLSVGDKSEAIVTAERAQALAPDDDEIGAIVREIMSADVPNWHFVLVQDTVRNDAYEAALRRAIYPGCRVLEIGTGTGLLAMMAARLGASHVYTCEMEPAIANVANRVIAENGLAEQITVISKRSQDIAPEELHGPVDILVSEIVSNDMLNEAVLEVMEDAVDRLVKPGGTIIPARGQVRVALGYYEGLEQSRMAEVSGFDLSAFNCLAPTSLQIPCGSRSLSLCSDIGDLFAFDFQSGGPWTDQRSEVTVSPHSGRSNGIAQWIALDMDDLGRYENRPSAGTQSCWAVMFHPFAQTVPRSTDPHEVLEICGRHDRMGLRIWKKTP